jgi:hypothetical protein
MNDYPMLHLLVRWGTPIAATLACLLVVIGVWAAWSSGNLLWGLLGLGGAAIGYGLLLSYVELIKLVMDMLLPK